MIGIDEVGRGCWAGPLLVVAARANSVLPKGLTDSKVLSKMRREELFSQLALCCSFGEGWISVSEIDENGLANAMRLGAARALESLKVLAHEEITLDGSVNYINKNFINVKCLISADLLEPIVSAASIYAKVTRDNFMEELGINYPKYGFASHVGYGTAKHREALDEFGVLTGIHRQSFKPVKSMVEHRL
jgi:ribonuclease HII